MREERAAILPGDPGIWVVILGDLVIFSLAFISYCTYLSLDPALFKRDQAELSQVAGLGNTVILLTSSLLVARALRDTVDRRLKQAASKLGQAALCGAAFAVIKAFDWTHLVQHGHTVSSSNFFMFFYILTGLHLFHLIVGVGVLLWMRVQLKPGAEPRDHVMLVQSGGLFWHLVDLLWVILFALLYVAH